MLEHKTREVNGCTVVDVAPAYTRQVFLGLLDAAREVVQCERPRLILNMDGLPHITSEGIGLLVLVHDECTQANGKMVLVNVPRNVERVLELAGVLNFFSIFPDETTGVEVLLAAVSEAGKGERDRPAEAAGEPTAQGDEIRPDQEVALRRLVSEVVKSRRHQQVVEFFLGRTTKAAPLDEVVAGTGVPREVAGQVLQDLADGGALVRDGEAFVWEPSADVLEGLKLFKNALCDPRLRSRVLAWIYAEEKKA